MIALVTALVLGIPPELEPDPDVWTLELGLHAQPDQERDHPCNPNVDCASPVQSFYAVSLAGSYEQPEIWSGRVTLGLGHGVDFEERPRGGFQVVTLRLDLQLELGRRRGEIGAALRVSQAIAAGWSSEQSAFGVDFPGFAVLVGTRELWGEVAIPTLPTQSDPRQFYAGIGWRPDGYTLDAGIAQFGALGYQHDTLDKTAANLGVWAHGTVRVAERWDVGAQLAIGYPLVLGATLAYRVARE